MWGRCTAAAWEHCTVHCTYTAFNQVLNQMLMCMCSFTSAAPPDVTNMPNDQLARTVTAAGTKV
jgi:hypothetical protein